MKRNRLSEERLLGTVDFVAQHGDGATQALARFFAGRTSANEALTAFAAYQLPDGGWMGIDRDFVGDISVVSCTHVALDWLAAIDPDDVRLLPKTLSHLSAIQKDDDGGWQSNYGEKHRVAATVAALVLLRKLDIM